MTKYRLRRLVPAAVAMALVLAMPGDVAAQGRSDRNRGNDRNDRGDRRGNNTNSNSNSSSSGNATNVKGMEAFRMVTRRNIFDPDRRPMPDETPDQPRQDIAPPVRSGYLTLTGTMVADGKQLAFFNGSQSEFNRVIAVNDQVAGCTVAGISSSHVDLKRGDQAIVLPVGKQLTLDATPRVVTPETPAADTASSTPGAMPSQPSTPSASVGGPPAGGPPVPGAPPGAPVDRAELMRRLMERRQKETSK